MKRAVLLAAALAPLFAMAGGHRFASTPMPARYRSECAACHVAYPPGLLPANSWARIMSDLPHHYGTDASLDAAAVTELSTWLVANAGAARDAPPQDRITQSPWFVREHRKVSASTWALPAVKNASNCTACHRSADQGVFNEHDVRIPR
jgi:hypothetical protein